MMHAGFDGFAGFLARQLPTKKPLSFSKDGEKTLQTRQTLHLTPSLAVVSARSAGWLCWSGSAAGR